MAAENVTRSGSVSVEVRRNVYWIRVLPEAIDLEVSRDIRRACLSGLERGVSDIVVELTDVEELGVNGLDTLEAAADELRAKHGTLWLANRNDETVGRIDLRQAPGTGLAEPTGLSAALDAALVAGGRLQPFAATTAEGVSHDS